MTVGTRRRRSPSSTEVVSRSNTWCTCATSGRTSSTTSVSDRYARGDQTPAQASPNRVRAPLPAAAGSRSRTGVGRVPSSATAKGNTSWPAARRSCAVSTSIVSAPPGPSVQWLPTSRMRTGSSVGVDAEHRLQDAAAPGGQVLEQSGPLLERHDVGAQVAPDVLAPRPQQVEGHLRQGTAGPGLRHAPRRPADLRAHDREAVVVELLAQMHRRRPAPLAAP